jgi:hypothetical protein
MLPVVAYLASASSAVTIVRGERDGALLAVPLSGSSVNPVSPGNADTDPASTRPASVTAPRLAPIPDATMRRALAARPLDQGIVNVAMVREIQAHAAGNANGQGAGATSQRAVVQGPVVNGQATSGYTIPARDDARLAAWMPVVAQLGWRDTATQFNRLYVAAAGADIATILDVSEALLRRQQLMDRITPVLAIVETDPKISLDLVRRLQNRPAWRGAYLESTTILTRRDQLVARYGILRELMRRGGRLTKSEVAANVIALDRGKSPELGFALWKAVHPDVVVPLNDPDFQRAAANSADDVISVPYDWQLLTGEGFSTDAFVEDGRSALEIKWNGRGVPVFVRQRTSARRGRYLLDIVLDPENIADLSAVQFRLMCDDTAIALRQDGKVPTRLATVQPVPCAYPVFEIVGDVQPSSTPRALLLHSLHLRPIA